MKPARVLVILLAYCGFSVFILIKTLLCMKNKTAASAGYIRFFSIIPAGIYGGVAAFVRSSNHSSEDAVGHRARVSESLHAVTGVALCVWAIIGVFAIRHLAKWKFDLIWSNRRRTTEYFVMFTVDMVFVVLMVAGCAVASTYLPLPWLFSSCSSDFCHGELLIQVMAIIHIFQVLGSAILIAPLMIVPRPVAGSFYAAATYIQLPFRSRGKAKVDYDVEKAMLVLEDDHGQTLGTLFRHDAIAAAIAQNLHVDDVSNVSMTSKHLRKAVLFPSPTERSQRKELLCESACVSGTKGECWACTKVICETCSTLNYKVLAPRTESHVLNCYAICTRCYFTGAQIQLGPLAARWKQHDLSVQHDPDCYRRASSSPKDAVRLCASCAALEPEALRDTRELREQASLRKTLVGRIRCNGCEIVLPRTARRWWLCDGGHECSWAGHKL